jgi:hypothetical protein
MTSPRRSSVLLDRGGGREREGGRGDEGERERERDERQRDRENENNVYVSRCTYASEEFLLSLSTRAHAVHYPNTIAHSQQTHSSLSLSKLAP